MRHPGRFLIASCVSAALLACTGTGGPAAPPQPPPLALPQGADGLYAQGRAHHAALRYAEAQQAYLEALALAPRHLNARNGLAVLYAGQGDYPQAIALWRELLRESGPAPEQAFLLANLGYAYLLDGQPDAALTVLEQACLRDPLKAQSWEHLALALERLGQDQRAVLMRRQAASLRAHDIGRDYAALAQPGVAAQVGSGPAPVTQTALPRPATAWPEEAERTELSQDGPGLVQLRRVGAPQGGKGQAALPTPAPAPAEPGRPAPGAPARVAISNGNGSRGLARALARSVDSEQLRVVRVSTLDFKVRHSRVEYRQGQQEPAARALAQRLGLDLRSACGDCRKADLRIVLGRDFREPAQGRRD